MRESWTPSRLLLAMGLLLIAVMAYGQAVLGADALDTDRATVLLMAQDFARGNVSVFFWQQNYMAAFEPLLLTPLAMSGLLTPTSAALVGVGVTAVIVILTLRLGARAGSVLWLLALLWALPSAVVVHHHVALYGARLVATLLALSGFVLALRAERAHEVMAVGFLAGLAYLGDHLMISWAVGIFYVLARRGHLWKAAWGAAPVLLFDTVFSLLAPTVHLSGPNDPGDWLWNPIRLVSQTIPQLFGLIFSRPPTPVFEEIPTLLPTGATWLLFSLPAAVVLAWIAGSFLKRSGDLVGRGTGQRGVLLGGLALTCLMAVGIFFLVGGGGDVWPVRYLVPLWPAVTVLVSTTVGQWTPRRRGLAVLVVLPALYTHLADPSWPHRADAEQARAEAEAVGQALRDTGVEAVWTDYWDTYRLAFLVDEGLPWATTRMLDRRHDWTAAAEAAAPVAYLVRPRDTEIIDALEGRSADSDSRVLREDTVASFRLYVTERSVPGVRRSQGSPSRIRFTAASVGPLLLFAGALLVVGMLVPLLFPVSYQDSTHQPEA